MSGVIDPFWLWDKLGFPGLVLGVALGLTVLVWVCAKARDRITAVTLATALGYIAGAWSAMQVRRNMRPKGE